MPHPALSVSLPYWQDRDPLDALAVAETAEKLGYDRLWIGEMATFDAFALATAIGTTPGRLPLCVGPLAVDVRTPVGIAMGAASVAALTSRGVDLALGTSSTVVVRDWHGRERRSTARHLEETARIVRALLAGERVEYEGVTERVNGFRLRLPTSPGGDSHAHRGIRADDSTPAGNGSDGHRPELVLAAFGMGALAAAARVADRVVLNLVTPVQVARCAALIEEFADRAGRETPPISVWVTAAADPSPDMLATLRRGVVGYLRAPGYDAMFTEAGFGEIVGLAHSGARPRAVLAAIPDELAAVVGMFGDRAELAARLAAYREAGADEVVVVPVTTAEDPGGVYTLETLMAVDRG
ncbi:LLM class flavin-dependent oxidoreductase [Nocardia yamanashiensis]|uniref:LLM class flavin-dependent oxidoreductase n=1 Tax=Nocardia yamanashiensis TaxID=209247 RepID=UPI00082B0316|nr:LLM class flavin-dependent oxidoreductase [Nocardia yamanashiensis]